MLLWLTTHTTHTVITTIILYTRIIITGIIRTIITRTGTVGITIMECILTGITTPDIIMGTTAACTAECTAARIAAGRVNTEKNSFQAGRGAALSSFLFSKGHAITRMSPKKQSPLSIVW
ncbi:hypothetical protein FE783_24695 [Paenibacillus mesophilus]|uniref:hypothetical protein n=1 Tax=Paenibacillus mesophilus TaxID=2582849 RepID=UPI00110EBF81|nr:hypothetical protein [Paenibacillus mesophilus]TMV46841.1 hypothetical protein FE783_24695 [Paenibacillus mesophilus]